MRTVLSLLLLPAIVHAGDSNYTVALFDPASEKFRVFPLPTKNEGIRKMIADAKGRLWYMSSDSEKPGVVE